MSRTKRSRDFAESVKVRSGFQAGIAVLRSQQDERSRLDLLRAAFDVNRASALWLCKRSLGKRDSFEQMVRMGIKHSDASEVKEWLALGESKLGAQGLLALLRDLARETPGAVQRAIYWLEGLLLKKLGRKLFRSEVARLRSIAADAAPKSGEHYTDGEILRLYVHVQEHPTPREKTVLDALASELGRSTGAVTMVIRWIDGANFRSQSSGRIKRQVERAREIYA